VNPLISVYNLSFNLFLYKGPHMTLKQHITLKFKDHQQRSLAKDNLGTRIEQVQLPKHLTLFILLGLLVQG